MGAAALLPASLKEDGGEREDDTLLDDPRLEEGPLAVLAGAIDMLLVGRADEEACRNEDDPLLEVELPICGPARAPASAGSTTHVLDLALQ